MRIEPIDQAEHLLVTCYSTGGSAVSEAVWFAGTNGRFVFSLDRASDLLRCVTGSPRVEVAVCDGKGRIRPGSVILAATARELDDDADTQRDRIRKKYGLKWRRNEAASELVRKIRKRPHPDETIVEITLTEAV